MTFEELQKPVSDLMSILLAVHPVNLLWSFPEGLQVMHIEGYTARLPCKLLEMNALM